VSAVSSEQTFDAALPSVLNEIVLCRRTGQPLLLFRLARGRLAEPSTWQMPICARRARSFHFPMVLAVLNILLVGRSSSTLIPPYLGFYSVFWLLAQVPLVQPERSSTLAATLHSFSRATCIPQQLSPACLEVRPRTFPVDYDRPVGCVGGARLVRVL
jgi:hypothetical protein